MNRSRLEAAAAAVVLAAAYLGPVPDAAREAPIVIIVFDGSGSMWGKFPGEANSKLLVAREALRSALVQVPPDTRVGLFATGARRRGDCTDVGVLTEPQPVDARAISGPLETFSPKGRGPIALALQEAAQTVIGASGPVSLILIHDDLDNCQKDPCAVAAELVKHTPKPTVHVVSLGLKPEDQRRMTCVAQATGGKMFDVQNGPAATAAIAAAVKLAALAATPAAADRSQSTKRAERAPAAEQPLPQDGPPGLRLIAALGPDGQPWVFPVRWRIRPASAADPDAATEASGAAVTVPLPAGTYEIEARAGLVAMRRTVEAAPKGPTPVRLILNAGALKLRALLKEAAPSARAVFTISEAAGTGKAGKTLWIGQEPEPHLVLPAGTYKIAAQDGLARTERTIAVPVGMRADLDLPLAAGRLRLQASQAETSTPLDAVFFQIEEDDPEAAQGRRSVAISAASRPVFTLPTGTYHVIARAGAAEARERVVVRAGEEVSRTLVLGVGRVLLTASLRGGTALLPDGVSYRAERLDGAARDVVQTSAAEAALDLPVGRYRVEGRLGAYNAKAVREIVVRPGSEQKVTLEFAAAEVKLRLADALSGLLSTESSWEVRDEAGNIVWRTIQPEPSAYLAAGRYRVRVGPRGNRREKSFEVKPAETQTVAIGAE